MSTPAPQIAEIVLDTRHFAFVQTGMTTRRGILHMHSGQQLVLRAGRDRAQAEVTGAYFRTLDSLTERDALREGFPGVTEMQLALLQRYPGLQPNEILTCIRFRRTT